MQTGHSLDYSRVTFISTFFKLNFQVYITRLFKINYSEKIKG